MLTDRELSQFIEAGVVTVDTPFTDRQIAEASAAKRAYDPELRRHLRPDRAHIVAV
jgi:hypothetical protein